MTTREKAIEYLDIFRNCKFSDFHRPFGTDCGMGFVLILLYSNEKENTAKEISEKMDVSMARVTSLMQKMEERGLVKRTPSQKDGRVNYISLTEKGNIEAQKAMEFSISIATKIIEELGTDEIDHFIKTFERIKNVLEKEEKLHSN